MKKFFLILLLSFTLVSCEKWYCDNYYYQPPVYPGVCVSVVDRLPLYYRPDWPYWLEVRYSTGVYGQLRVEAYVFYNSMPGGTICF
jgi:hypothetical protein